MVAVEWRDSLELWGRRGEIRLLNVGFLYLIMFGSLPRICYGYTPIACANLCFQLTALGRKKKDLTSIFLTAFMERINELISIKYLASHR